MLWPWDMLGIFAWCFGMGEYVKGACDCETLVV